MDRLSLRVKAVFFPSLIIALFFVAGTAFLHWLLVRHFHVFKIGEFLLAFIVSCALLLVAMCIFVYPRTRIFAPAQYRQDVGRMSVFVLAYTLALLPACIAQSYLVTDAEKLTTLTSISDLYSSPPTKYYNIKHVYVDKRRASRHTSKTVGGHNNDFFCFAINYVVPILKDSIDTILTPRTVWLGIEYNDEVLRRRTSKEELDSAWQQFVDKSEISFKERDLSKFACLQEPENNVVYARFNTAIQQRLPFYKGNSAVLIPLDEPYEARNGNTFAWIFGSMGVIGLVLFVVVALATLDEKEVRHYLRKRN